jgi:hypothetical protein
LKKFLLLISFFNSFPPAFGQTYWKLDPQNEWTGTEANWNDLQQSNATLSSGNFTQSNLIKSDGSRSNVSFNGLSGFTHNSATPMQGNNNGAFTDLIENHGWYFSNGAQFKFTRLDNSKYYTVYILAASWAYEGGTVSFSVGVKKSNSVVNNLNVGDRSAYSNWENDPALNKLVNISPTGGAISVTMNLSGYGAIEAVILKEQTKFWEPTNPAAPTSPVVDDNYNSFNFHYNPLYTRVDQYEYTLDSGFTWHELQKRPLYINNVSIKKGYIGVRVKDTLDNGPGLVVWSNKPFTIVAPNPPPSIITIKVVLSGTPLKTARLVPANLKYNKWGRFGITADNRTKDVLTVARYLDSKTFTDGATTNKHNMVWSGSLGTQAYWGKDTTTDAGGLTWSQTKDLVSEGWSILDNGAFNGIATAGATALGFNQLMNSAQNRRYTFNKLSLLGTPYVLRFGLVPKTEKNYHSAWEQLGYLGGTSTTVDDNYPGTVTSTTNHGLVNVTHWKSDNQYKVHLRHFNNLSSGSAGSQDFFDAAFSLSSGSTPSNNYSVEFGFTAASPGTVKKVIDSAYAHFDDHIWVCGLQEFYEYFETIQQTAIKQQITGDTLIVTVDQTFLNQDQRWRDMSFVLNSNVSLHKVFVTGADDYSYNSSTGLINIFKKKTVGYAMPDDAFSTGFTFHSKIQFSKDNVFIDNHYDNPPSALVDRDVNTIYNTGGGMLYHPYEVTFNLSDFGAVVDSVRIKLKGEVGYTTHVILTRNDNEAEDSIGVFTGDMQNKWVTIKVNDSASRYVASRVILRSNSKSGFGTEVEVYGDYLPYAGQAFRHRETPLKYSIGTNGHWWNFNNNSDGSNNENAFKAVDSMHLYSVRLYGDVDGYQDSTGSSWYFNPVRGGWNETKLFRRFREVNPNTIRFSVMQGQSLAIRKQWNTPDSTWQLEGIVTNVDEKGAYSIISMKSISILAGAAGSSAGRIRIIKKGSPNAAGRNSDNWMTLVVEPKTFGTDPNSFHVGDTIIMYNRYKSALNIPYPQGTTVSARKLPRTYDTLARVAYVWTARNGRNPAASKFNPAPGNNDSVGLNTGEWIEVMNEPTASWAGFNDYLNGNHLGLAWSKIYDNNKIVSETLGAKNADTSMVVSTSGLAVSDPDVMYGAEFWARRNRGGRPKGHVPTTPMTWKARTWGWTDNPYDVVQFHNYSYTGGSNQYAGNVQSGQPIELSHSLEAIDGFVKFRNKYAPAASTDIGEWGYDVAQRSPMNAPPIDSYTAEQIRGAWSLRTMLVYNVHGIDYAQWYRFAQDAPQGDTSDATQFGTMSLIKWDYKNSISLTTVGRQFGQLSEFGDYVYDSTLSEDSIYCYRFKKDAQYLYVIWGVETSPNISNWQHEKAIFHERAGSYRLPLKKGAVIKVREPQNLGVRMNSVSAVVPASGFQIRYKLVPTFIMVAKSDVK